MSLLFAGLCLAIAVYSFFVVFVAVHIWLVATILLRLLRGQIRPSGAVVLRRNSQLVWWDGRYGWDEFLPLYITLVGAGVIASAWRYSKRMRERLCQRGHHLHHHLPPPDATNVIPFVRLHVSGAARRGSDRSG